MKLTPNLAVSVALTFGALAFSLLSVQLAYADHHPGADAVHTVTSPTSNNNSVNTVTSPSSNRSGCAPGTLCNPLRVGSLSGLLFAIVDIIVVFAVPIIVFFLIYAGFLYVTARGNVEQVKKVHTTFLWTLIGGVIVLGARVLVEVIQGTVDAFR